MPRKRKFIKAKRYAAKRKKVYRRRYTRKRLYKGKRGRFRKYHKKRALAKMYGLRKYAGIKWTRYLSLDEFLTDDKFDLNCLFKYTIGSDATSVLYTNGTNSYLLNQTGKTDLTSIAKATFTVYSSDLWSNKTMLINPSSQGPIYYKAYSPYPCEHNLGPLFNIYCNQYKKMKYVGMKVKWIPGVRNMAPSYHVSTIGTIETYNTTVPIPYQASVTASGTTTYTLNDDTKVGFITTNPNYESFREAIPSATHIYSTSDPDVTVTRTPYPNLITPPALRLWICFDKQGYESYDWHVNCVNNVDYASTAGTSTLPDCRFRFRRVFDSNGVKTSINDSLVHSYNLLKPFKFFVRPKVARKVYENIENENTLRNAEPINSTLTRSMVDSASPTSTLIETSKKMPYLSVLSTHPQVNTLPYSDFDVTNAGTMISQLLKTLSSVGYLDPILFGWGLSCDNIDVTSQLDIFQIRQIRQFGTDSPGNFRTHMVGFPENWKGYGKMKVTYYCRFKDFNPLQKRQTLDTSNAEIMNDDLY